MNQSNSKIEKQIISPKQQCMLPSLYCDYSARKKQKLKTYFRQEQCSSISPNKQIIKTQRDLLKQIDSERNSELYSFEDEVSRSFKFQRKSRLHQRNKILNQPIQNKKLLLTDTTQIETDTPYFKDKESSISQSNDESEEKNENKIDVKLEGETGKALKQISHKINQELNNSFYHFIKKSEKMKDLILNFQQKDNLSPIHYYCLNDSIFPKRIELNKQDVKEINLSDLGLTPKYIPLIRNLLSQKRDKNIKSIDISQNKINEWSLKLLIDVFPLKVKTINLSLNQLNRRGAVLLSEHLKNFENLRFLNLKGNQIGDIGTVTILEALKPSLQIKKLNLSDNAISDSISYELKEFIIKNQSLQVISLNWNQLGPIAGLFIAKGLNYNKSIKVVDLSYNKIGQSDNNYECIKEWCSLLSNTYTELIHLDLSYNQFNEKQLQLINYSILKNSRLYGLHVEGNKCLAHVDPLGFIQFPQQIKGQQSMQPKHQNIDGVNFIPMLNENENGSDCCWICQGWMEYHFIYEPEPEESKTDSIYLHLDFLDFKPISMTTSKELWKQISNKFNSTTVLEDLTTGEIIHQLKYAFSAGKIITMTAINDAYTEDNKIKDDMKSILSELNSKFFFTSYQMCPPNQKILYFFSNPTGKGIFINPRFPIIQLRSNENIELIMDKEKVFFYPDGSQISLSQVDQVNYFQTKQMFVIDQKNQYKPLVKVIPRCLDNKYFLKRFAVDASKQKSNLIYWQKEQSAFKSYQGDTQDVLDECFQFDWTCMGIQHFLKNEQEVEKVIEIMRSHYPKLKDIYKYYSSFGYNVNKQQNGYQVETFNIPLNLIYDLTQELLPQDIQIEEVQSQVNQIKYNCDSKFIYNPEKGFVRYQFIEFIFRIALLVTKQKQKPKQIVDEVYRIFQVLTERFAAFDNQQQWREERLWTKECGNLIYIKQGFIQRLHDYVACIKNKKWTFKLKWIALTEFIDFCNQMGFQQFLSDTQLKIIYNFAMQTHQDELTQDRHLRMSTVEFTEALARIAEFISPNENDINNISINRLILPLHIKLENLLTHIFNTLRILKVNNFENFSIYFSLNPIPILPKVHELQQDQYECTTQELRIYNTLSYLKMFKIPYLNPNYKQFLEIPFQLVQNQKQKRSIVERQMTQKQKLLKLKATLQLL
ncbi:unnamed protein product [Paramecium pentaurelia]|uniref:Leucine Rich Repeat family protein n=1 Tax=Paramecium pentaurelia TaxID=43138 RepID=A0A8S1V6K0_9CILI|nr:unnamed protein product [Paramecium pentaurelia]